jgi:phage baseplate assembly protein W
MATTNIDSVRNYRDLDLNFAIHPITKDVNIYKAEYSVINSVKNLILTNHFEKPFQPEVGSNLRRLLFENIDSIIAAQIEREIEETITNFEPRVQISSVVAVHAPDENGYKIRLEFFVINNPDPITINFFLERIR